MTELTQSNFEELVYNSNKPVMVKFHAPWCGPCKTLTPIFNDFESKQTDVTCYSANLEENQIYSVTHGVRNIPAVLLFKNGNVVDRLIGMQTNETLTELSKK